MDRFKKAVVITVVAAVLMTYGIIFLMLPANEMFLWLGFVLLGVSSGLLPVGLFAAFLYIDEGEKNEEEMQET